MLTKDEQDVLFLDTLKDLYLEETDLEIRRKLEQLIVKNLKSKFSQCNS